MDMSFLSSASQMLGGVFTGLKYALIALAIGGAAYFFGYYMKFKHKIVLKKITSDGTKIIKEDSFCYTKNEQGIGIIKTLWTGLSLSTPPSSAIDKKENGKEYVQAYLFGKNQVLYITDKTTEADIKKEIINFKPIDSEYEASLVFELDESRAWKKESWLHNLPFIVSAVVLIILVAIFVFWGAKLLQPVLDAQQTNLQQTIENEKVTEMQAQTYRAMTILWQKITGETLPENSSIPQTIPQGG